MADTALEPERRARADLLRFLAACYYEPGPEFAEERLFDSMTAAAARVDGSLAADARQLGDAFSAEGLEALRVDYTRLFLGSPQALAQPYASVWLQESAAAFSVLPLYREGGFDLSQEFRDLPDHIAAELEFLYLLTHRGDRPDLQARFLRGHLALWLGRFAQAVQQHSRTAFYRQLAELTQRAVALEAARA